MDWTGPMLVTGGAGFIGSHIAEALLARGAAVRVIDDLFSGHRGNVPAAADFREASILDADALRDAMAECAVVFHQAAMVSVPQSVAEPQRCAAVNIEGTAGVLEAARELGVGRVVFASSSAVYGGEPRRPSEEGDPVESLSPYAASKAAGEGLVAAYGRCYDMSTVSLRYFNVFGPRQDPRSPYAAVVAAFVDAVAAGRAPIIFGDGGQTRDFVPVANVVHANLLAASSPRPLQGERVNVGLGSSITLLELLAAVERVIGVSIPPRFDTPRPGDVLHSAAGITLAGELLGYEPIEDLENGLRRLVE